MPKTTTNSLPCKESVLRHATTASWCDPGLLMLSACHFADQERPARYGADATEPLQ